MKTNYEALYDFLTGQEEPSFEHHYAQLPGSLKRRIFPKCTLTFCNRFAHFQAGNAARTLTLMQGFEKNKNAARMEKKRKTCLDACFDHRTSETTPLNR